MVSVKFSILALYWRLFKLSIRVPILILASIVTCWGIAVFLTTVFQCVPVRGFWDKTINATCGVNVYAFFYGNSIPNISTDVAILILPMPLIWRLRIPQSQKIMLSGIFILGGFIIAVSITRLIYLINLDLHSPDVTWNFGVTQIWTCVEMNIAVVCGSLNPSFRQPNVALLGTSSPNRDASWSNAKSSTTIFAGDGSASKATSADNSKNRYAGLSDHKNGKFGKTNGSENPSVNTSIKEVRDMNGISGIRVQNDIGIQWHATGGN
ncbi:hypothetical protein MMC22_003838 [Lobaria immixta]|nr:hypothetical protein [Lobaria immixta]